MKTFAFAAFMAAVNANSVPIFGKIPGWRQGVGKAAIEIEFVWDYLCSDSKAAQPILKELWEQPFNGSTVRDQVTWTITPFPLDYHVHSW